jgi:hypothetical protein
MGLHLMSMRLIGMHLIGVYLIGVDLIGMHLMGMHLLTRTRNRSPDPFHLSSSAVITFVISLNLPLPSVRDRFAGLIIVSPDRFRFSFNDSDWISLTMVDRNVCGFPNAIPSRR